MPNTSVWTSKDTLTATLVVVIWGLNFVPMKLALQALSPFELGLGRYLFAALPLCFFIKPPAVRFRWLLATAVCQAVGQFSLLFIALQVGMTAALASVLLQTQVYFTALWGFIIYRHRPTALLWISMGSAAIGLLFFAQSALGGEGAQGITLTGILYMLASAAMWGVANLISGQAHHESPDYNPLGYIVWSSVIACGFYVALVGMFTPQSARWLDWATWQAISGETWLSIAYLGWVSTLAGYALWTLLLKRHPANRVAPFSLGVPVIGLLAGLLWLGEPIDGWQWCGSVFVGLSLLLVVFGPRYWMRGRR